MERADHHTLEIFPTFVHAFALDETANPTAVLARIGELRQLGSLTDEPGAGRGQFDFMSRTDLHLDPAFAGFLALSVDCARQALDDEGWRYDDLEVVECWANVSGSGNSHRVHARPPSASTRPKACW